jgi:hypothetical protein
MAFHIFETVRFILGYWMVALSISAMVIEMGGIKIAALAAISGA